MTHKFKTIALIGFSGVGKTELAKDLSKTMPHTYNRVITNTSREMREGEVDKVDYNFITEEEFKSLIDNKLVIEHAKFNNAYYGMSLNWFNENKINLVVCEPSGVMHLHNHPKIDLLHIINIEREFSLIIDSIKDEKRIRQITQRRMSKEEERELEKIPVAIRNEIINFENNSSDIKYTTMKFNKTFNAVNIVNLYDYELDDFLKENISGIKKNINKTKNETLKFLLSYGLQSGNTLLNDLAKAKENLDLNFMSKINSFMDTLEILKIYYEHRRQTSNQFTRPDFVEVYNKYILLKDYESIKYDFNELKNQIKVPELNLLEFEIFEKEINKYIENKNKFFDRQSFRKITTHMQTFKDYISVARKTITNPIALNSSWIVDAAHVQFDKYKKKHFQIIIDEIKFSYLENDMLYKIFINNGEKTKLNIIVNDEDKFVVSSEKKVLFAFPISKEKLKLLNLPQEKVLDYLIENPMGIKNLPYTLESITLYKRLIDNNLIAENFNSNLYVKNQDTRKKVDVLLLEHINNNNAHENFLAVNHN